MKLLWQDGPHPATAGARVWRDACGAIWVERNVDGKWQTVTDTANANQYPARALQAALEKLEEWE